MKVSTTSWWLCPDSPQHSAEWIAALNGATSPCELGGRPCPQRLASHSEATGRFTPAVAPSHTFSYENSAR